MNRIIVAMLLLLAAPLASGQIEEVIVSSTPLGAELPASRVPGYVQQATSDEIERVRTAGLAQFLNQRLGGVFINEAQNNPLQPDVQFRGFIASPLLGQPQGIAVYQDGVRINDPFGDVVVWALVPEAAIDTIDLIPGSNPVFGLNALGGALSIHTKDGFNNPGTQAEVMGGSFGRVVAEASSGASVDNRLSYFVSARYLTEDGWRQYSPSDALHVFADTGWRNDTSSLDLNLTWVETDLIGNGPAPVQLLAQNRDAVYTRPDRTENSLAFLTLTGKHDFARQVELTAVAYYRRSNIHTLNGDESNFEECNDAALEGYMCEEGADEEQLVHDPAGELIPFSNAVEGATLNRSKTRQDTSGVSAQLAILRPLAGRDNRLILGGTVDRSRIRFASSTELGHLDETRDAIGGGFLVDEAFVDLHADIDTSSAFLTDTFSITPDLDVTLSARYNDTRIELRDQIGTALNGDHSYTRFNRAAGVTYRPAADLRLYASYSESNRAPSPVELTCADENDPCALPNAFLSDPPLQQVVARTYETGASGTWLTTHWHAGLFRTINRDDILFISAGALTNRGFFTNVGDTRRQGIELALNGELRGERAKWFLTYTRLDAEFRHSFTVASPHNPAAENGEIPVARGSRIPGTPEHLLKAGVDVRVTSQLRVNVDLMYSSNQYFRGDEGNLTEPLPSYTVVNAGAEWQLSPNLTLFTQIENVFDRNYATFGLFGAGNEVLGPGFDDPRFVSPGGPRSAWLGVRWKL